MVFPPPARLSPALQSNEKDKARLDFLLSTWEARNLFYRDALSQMRSIVEGREGFCMPVSTSEPSEKAVKPVPASKLISQAATIHTFVNQAQVTLDKNAVNRLMAKIQSMCGKKAAEVVHGEAAITEEQTLEEREASTPAVSTGVEDLLLPVMRMVADKLLSLHESCLSAAPVALPSAVIGDCRVTARCYRLSLNNILTFYPGPIPLNPDTVMQFQAIMSNQLLPFVAPSVSLRPEIVPSSRPSRQQTGVPAARLPPAESMLPPAKKQKLVKPSFRLIDRKSVV